MATVWRALPPCGNPGLHNGGMFFFPGYLVIQQLFPCVSWAYRAGSRARPWLGPGGPAGAPGTCPGPQPLSRLVVAGARTISRCGVYSPFVSYPHRGALLKVERINYIIRPPPPPKSISRPFRQNKTIQGIPTPQGHSCSRSPKMVDLKFYNQDPEGGLCSGTGFPPPFRRAPGLPPPRPSVLQSQYGSPGFCVVCHPDRSPSPNPCAPLGRIQTPYSDVFQNPFRRISATKSKVHTHKSVLHLHSSFCEKNDRRSTRCHYQRVNKPCRLCTHLFVCRI